jgi:molybdenum cofactor guanylyltransferase
MRPGMRPQGPESTSATLKGGRIGVEVAMKAYLLTGGASRRMGQDKASLLVQGEPLGHRIARLLCEAGHEVLVLGRTPIARCGFQPDEEEFSGPLGALARAPRPDGAAFVCSCDLPWFDGRLPDLLHRRLDSSEASVPVSQGRLQPLCAVYTRACFDRLSELDASGEARMMSWLAGLDYTTITEQDLASEGLDPRCIRNVNRMSEWSEGGGD